MSVVSPFWTAGSAYTLTSVASNIGFNLANTLPVFQTALGSTLIRFQLMKLAGFTRVACYSEYKTVDEWLAFGVGYNENGFSYNPAQHNFNLGTYPEISFTGTECALTAGESYAVQPELSWQTLAGTFAFSNPTAPSPPGGVGLAPILYDIYGSLTQPPPTGLSNVLFLPGLEASRLYMQKSVLGMQVEDQLWEPNAKSDVEDLFLNVAGESVNTGIYTRDIINKTNVFPMFTSSIYEGLISDLDNLVQTNKINSWTPYAYDWRQDINDIIDNGTRYEEGKISLINTLQSLSSTSQTGKVTIITHSNGGLLAKALIKKLQDMKSQGQSDLVDKIDVLVLVASPQLGTPSAVAALLHGYDQSLRFKSIEFMSGTQARKLAQNMSSAYGLLPSPTYFNQTNISAVGNFASSSDPLLKTVYGSDITTYQELHDFVLGQEGRTQPVESNLIAPIKGNAMLLTEGEALHNTIDTMIMPSNIEVFTIGGWGKTTISGIKYVSGDLEPITTIRGDKTVVMESSMYGSGTKFWLDLSDSTLNHADILEDQQLLAFINSIILKENTSFLSNSEPVQVGNRLHQSVHSPISIGLYDTQGNFTGKVCAESGECEIQENIPGSTYLEFGEGKYVYSKETGIQKTVLQGTGTGTFTYISEKVTPLGQITTSTFTDIPVTTQTQGEVVLNTVTQVPELKLDVTGDGTVDFTLVPTAEFDPVIFLQIMKQTIESFDIKQARKATLSKRIDGIIKSIQKGKIPKAQLKAERFQNALKAKVTKLLPKKPKPQRLTNADAEVLIGMLETLLNNLEK
jgi:hypothetical protein